MLHHQYLRKLATFFLRGSILLSVLAGSSVLAQPISKLTQRCNFPDARTCLEIIRGNRPANVQRTSGSNNSWTEATTSSVLRANNWLATGPTGWVRMFYNQLGVAYTQEEHTVSQFYPQDSSCGFRVQSGKFLYAEHGPGRISCNLDAGSVTLPTNLQANRTSSINLASKNIETPVPQADTTEGDSVVLFIYRNQDSQEVIVGVLASPNSVVLGPGESVVFSNFGSNETVNSIELREGEYAYVRSNGKFERGLFSLELFYAENPFTLGFGPSQEDQEYIDLMEDLAEEEDQEEEFTLISEIRQDTLRALFNQPTPGPLEVVPLGRPNINLPSPIFPGGEIDDVQVEVTPQVVSPAGNTTPPTGNTTPPTGNTIPPGTLR